MLSTLNAIISIKSLPLSESQRWFSESQEIY